MTPALNWEDFQEQNQHEVDLQVYLGTVLNKMCSRITSVGAILITLLTFISYATNIQCVSPIGTFLFPVGPDLASCPSKMVCLLYIKITVLVPFGPHKLLKSLQY